MVILIVGSRGSGKTTAALKIADKFPNQLILDLYNEHTGDLVVNGQIPKKGIKRISQEAADPKILFEILARLRNHFILLEDSTIIFSGNVSDANIKRVVIGSRHHHNTIIFIFHSLQRIPLFLFEQANYLTLFKTTETKQTFYRIGSPEIERIYNELSKSNDPHINKTIKL
tara:strand:+ start:3738 stop:4250 length:513 start_codon:yes stop_codon:yes gene_type:complete